MKLLTLSFVLLTLGVVPSVCLAQKDKKDTAVEPTSSGKVLGNIYDASTGAPIADAVIRCKIDGEFPRDGKSVGKTDSAGHYQCDAILGRVSSNVDVGRLLASGPIAIILGGATNKTKRIDISRLSVQVSAGGFHEFTGTVFCRSVDPEKFEVVLEPILLTSASTSEVSTAASGWGTVELSSVKVESAIVHPKDKTKITVIVSSPKVVKLKDLTVHYFAIFPGKIESGDLKAGTVDESGKLTFSGELSIPKNVESSTVSLHVSIVKCPYDVVDGQRHKSLKIQIIKGEAEAAIAAQRSKAFDLEQSGDVAGSEAMYKDICADPLANKYDFAILANLAHSLKDYGVEVDAATKIVKFAPNKPENSRLIYGTRLAMALAADNEGGRLLNEFKPQVDAIPPKDREKNVPLQLMLAMGQADIQTGKLDEAEAISREMNSWKSTVFTSDFGVFQNSLRLAKAVAKVKSDPSSASSHLEYAHVLMDSSRWEESVAELQQAQKTEPNLPTIQRDIAYAMLHLNGNANQSNVNIDDAIASAEKQVVIEEKGKLTKTKDFFAWHSLAMLYFAKASDLESKSDPGATSSYMKCVDTLREALRCGRSGATVNQGNFNMVLGYTSPKVVAISGFAYPEANSDFVLLQSLSELSKRPDDYLALFDMATALIDLGQPQLASKTIKRVLALKPDFIEAKYASALISAHNGDREAAIVSLKETLKVNPRHPKANFTLAKLLTEDGDVAGAAECLANHAKYYGKRVVSTDIEVPE